MLELTDLNTFLKMFSGNNITEKQFFNKAQVRVGDKLHPLDEYIKIKKIHKLYSQDLNVRRSWMHFYQGLRRRLSCQGVACTNC